METRDGWDKMPLGGAAMERKPTVDDAVEAAVRARAEELAALVMPVDVPALWNERKGPRFEDPDVLVEAAKRGQRLLADALMPQLRRKAHIAIQQEVVAILRAPDETDEEEGA